MSDELARFQQRPPPHESVCMCCSQRPATLEAVVGHAVVECCSQEDCMGSAAAAAALLYRAYTVTQEEESGRGEGDD